MTMRTFAVLLALLPLGGMVRGEDFGFDPALEAEKARSIYFAPENQLTFKVVFPGGAVHEFERDYTSEEGGLRSAGGWSARFLDHGRVAVKSPPGPDGITKFVFERGRLVSLRHGGVTTEFPADERRSPPENVYPPLAITLRDSQAAARAYAENSFLHKWDGTGRLQFPFVNPNQCGVLYAQLLLVALSLALAVRRRIASAVCALVAAASGVALVWTMSRGAWLGCALALVPLAALHLRALASRRSLWLLAGALVLAFGLWAAFHGFSQVTRGFDGAGGNWTNAIRLEILGKAPRMMYAAPGGWAFCTPGTAYLNWFQPLTVFALTPTLINDHLTRLVAFGWAGRGAYVLGWCLVFAAGLVGLVKCRRSLALGLWTVLFVAASFNPVSHVWTLWMLPVAATAELLLRLPRRPVRLWVGAGLASVALAALVTGGLWLKGRADAAHSLPVAAADRRVTVNGARPEIWIVDDGMLGGGLTGKDIREFYEAVPRAPAMGYVTSIEDLPEDVQLLVLSGETGSDWLLRLSENPAARAHLPKMVVFVSPPFSPSQIPPGLLAACRVKVVVGEFAASFDPDYRIERPWVKVVPGMERYVLRWLEHVLGA